MLTSQRVLFSDNGTIADYSMELGDYRVGTVTPAYTVAQDFLYLGSEYPFNHKWFDVGTANAVASSVTVHIWDGSAWNAAVDVLDGTKVGGASLAQDGFIRWSTDRLKGWSPEQDSSDVTGLTSTDIYDLYWTRLTWSATLTAGMTLLNVGSKFATDAALHGFYPDLNNSDLMAQFAAGKSDWGEQHYAAADAIVRELKRKGIIFSRAQVFDYEMLTEPAIHKAAEIIYGGMGAAFRDHMAAAKGRFHGALDIGQFNIDLNADGALDESEKRSTMGYMTR